MSPSTEATEAEREFATQTLRNLLQRIDSYNPVPGRHSFIVSHAWADGATIYLVYTAPPSDVVWGLVRDTRESIVDGDTWTDVDEAALYYYLLDLEENWPGNFSRQPGESEDIRWSGDLQDDLPTDLAGLPEAARRSPSNELPVPAPAGADVTAVAPRRYADPQ